MDARPTLVVMIGVALVAALTPRSVSPAARSSDVHAIRANAECASCHVAVAAEWRTSLHRASADDPSYQHAFALEPLAFCDKCHAPTPLGIACTSCHANFTHGAETKVDCARCHEFAFPGNASGPLMQSTATEHAASRYAATLCRDCHMPRAAGHRSHRFVASRDAAFVASAVKVTATRVSSSLLRIQLMPDRIGHAFPTGDLFRRIEVAATRAGVVVARRYLGRHRPEGAAASVDDRVGPAGVAVVLEVTPGEALRYRVTYQRVAHPTSDREEDAVVEGEVVIAEAPWPELSL